MAMLRLEYTYYVDVDEPDNMSPGQVEDWVAERFGFGPPEEKFPDNFHVKFLEY